MSKQSSTRKEWASLRWEPAGLQGIGLTNGWAASREGEMRIGILGSGLMGGRLGTLFARARHEVVFS
jgi:hypothetical protein